ncbi:hypothetical protein Tco_0933350, partial [Tanacetum coccineum]
MGNALFTFSLRAAVLTGLAVLIDAAAIGELCLAVLTGLAETDIRQKDEKSSKNSQNQARNGKAWKRQSQIEAK